MTFVWYFSLNITNSFGVPLGWKTQDPEGGFCCDLADIRHPEWGLWTLNISYGLVPGLPLDDSSRAVEDPGILALLHFHSNSQA